MNKETEKISAKPDLLLLIIVGQKNIMELLIKNLKENEKEKYILTKISNPSAHQSLELMKSLNNIEDENLLNSTTQKAVLIDDGVECAQCYVYGEGSYSSDSYMLQQVIDNGAHYTLGFLKFPLCEDDNPETIIEEWFKKNTGKAPNGIKKNTKLVTVAGINSNILVVSTRY
jgi:hypothetical protein